MKIYHFLVKINRILRLQIYKKQKQSVPRQTPVVSPLLLFFKLNSRSSILNVVFGFHFFLILRNSVSIFLE